MDQTPGTETPEPVAVDSRAQGALDRLAVRRARSEAEIGAVLARFPEDEHDAARRGLYRDADGAWATRHRLLRSL